MHITHSDAEPPAQLEDLRRVQARDLDARLGVRLYTVRAQLIPRGALGETCAAPHRVSLGLAFAASNLSGRQFSNGSEKDEKTERTSKHGIPSWRPRPSRT